MSGLNFLFKGKHDLQIVISLLTFPELKSTVFQQTTSTSFVLRIPEKNQSLHFQLLPDCLGKIWYQPGVWQPNPATLFVFGSVLYFGLQSKQKERISLVTIFESSLGTGVLTKKVAFTTNICCFKSLLKRRHKAGFVLGLILRFSVYCLVLLDKLFQTNYISTSRGFTRTRLCLHCTWRRPVRRHLHTLWSLYRPNQRNFLCVRSSCIRNVHFGNDFASLTYLIPEKPLWRNRKRKTNRTGMRNEAWTKKWPFCSLSFPSESLFWRFVQRRLFSRNSHRGISCPSQGCNGYRIHWVSKHLSQKDGLLLHGWCMLIW